MNIDLLVTSIINGDVGETDLRRIASALINRMQLDKNRKIAIAKNTFRSGDSVRLTGLKSGNGLTGRIIDIRTKKASVRMDNGGQNYLVPMNCLVKI